MRQQKETVQDKISMPNNRLSTDVTDFNYTDSNYLSEFICKHAFRLSTAPRYQDWEKKIKANAMQKAICSKATKEAPETNKLHSVNTITIQIAKHPN